MIVGNYSFLVLLMSGKEGFFSFEFDLIGERLDLMENFLAQLSLRVNDFVQLKLKVDVLLIYLFRRLVPFNCNFETKYENLDCNLDVNETCLY